MKKNRLFLMVILTCLFGMSSYGQTTTVNFANTGAVQTWVVPAGITSINVQAIGGQGGAYDANLGGFGGDIKADIVVTPGETLKVYVGGNGADGTIGVVGGGGGGSSAITLNNDTPLLVAGGGGGGSIVAGTVDLNGGGVADPSANGCGEASGIAGTGGAGEPSPGGAGGGAGWLGNGGVGGSGTVAALSYLNGGTGGIPSTGAGSGQGGFGGGGAGFYGTGSNGYGGGGGGYSGGAGASKCGGLEFGIGGSSFVTSTGSSNVFDLKGTVSQAPKISIIHAVVIDVTPPVAVCSTGIVLNVGSNVTAVLLDGGSTDDSGIPPTPSIPTDPYTTVCGDLGTPSFVLTVTDGVGNTGTASCSVTVTEAIPPVAVCPATIADVVLSGTGSGMLPANIGAGLSTDNCGTPTETSPTAALTCANVGSNNVVLTADDGNGNTTPITCTYNVVDNIAPVAVCPTTAIADVVLDGTGAGTLPANIGAGLSTDNCGTPTETSPTAALTCANLGSNNVVLTADDGNGNTTPITCTYDVVDNIAPVAVCPTTAIADVVLDGTGAGTLPANIGAGLSTDNCGTPTETSPTAALTCANIGSNNVVLTADDGNGNTTPITCTYNVVDNIAPVAVCPTTAIADVVLDGSGAGTLPANIGAGLSTDNCGTPTETSPTAALTCANLGSNNVVLTADDGNGNTTPITCTYNVVDNIAPVAVCPTTAIADVVLDGSGAGTLPANIGAGLSTDNCGTPTETSPTAALTCANLGSNNVVLTADDGNGNTTPITCTYDVVDNIAPVAVCPTTAIADVVLDGSGAGTLPANIGAGLSTDNCGTPTETSPTAALTCANVGSNNVVLTADDGNGNTTPITCTYNVVDNIAPVAVCPTTAISDVVLDGTGAGTLPANIGAGLSTDNCGTPTETSPTAALTCANIGSNNVVLTADDGNGNTTPITCTYNVVDNIAPVAVCPTSIADVVLSGTGSGMLSANIGAGLSTDNCTATETSPSVVVTCANLGTNSITLSVTDGTNSTSTTCSYNVVDNEMPVAVCPASIADVDLAGTGAGTLPADIGDGSSTDNCTATETSPSVALTCGNLGSNSITLSVTDGTNSTSTTCSYNVVDNSVLAAICPVSIPDVVLSGTGSGMLGANIGDASSTGGCTVTEMSPSVVVTCANLGTNSVTLTVTDGTISTSTSCNYNVVDTEMPVAVCPASITDVALDATGNGTLPADIGDGSSTDNCTATETSPSVAVACANLGTNSVTLSVTDGTNSTSTTCSYTVVDNELPVAVCPASITDVALDATGNGTLPADIGDGSSTDNCSTTETSPSQGFTCADLGSNLITLTVSDGTNLDSKICSFNVVDNEMPVPVCPASITDVALDATGNGTLPADIGDGSSTDNCTATETSPTAALTCANLGSNTVTLTVTDGTNSTSTTCSFNVIDNEMPVAVCPAAITDVALDATGNGSLPANIGDGSSTDNCTATETSPSAAVTCANLGSNLVILSVTDGTNSTSTGCIYTVVDNEMPVAVCPASISDVILSGTGSGMLSANIGDGSSTDNCSATETSPSVVLTCANLGANSVTLSVTDGTNSTSTSCSYNVVDDEMPVAVCPVSIPDVALDATGNGTLPADIGDGSSTDNCTATETSPSVALVCANLGSNIVTLTVTDGTNSTSTTCSYNVVDNEMPVAVCPASITDVALDATGNGTLPADIGDGSSTDNCSTTETSPSMVVTCANLGTNSVTLSVTDGTNSSTTACNYTVVDNEFPIAVCPASITDVALDATGNGTLPADIGDGSSTDNCTVTETSPSVVLTCANLGANSVTLSVTDGTNSTSTTCSYTVVDSELPVAVCPVTIADVALDATGNGTLPADIGDGSSTDNCSVFIEASGSLSFGCGDVGSQVVVLTAIDGSGNLGTANCTFNVVDNETPVAVCPASISGVYLNSGGFGAVGSNLGDGSSTDNCTATETNPASLYDCSHVGTQSILITATDMGGNMDTISCSFEVFDTITPIAICPVDIILDTNYYDYSTLIGAFDNCTVSDTVIGPAIGSFFPIGVSDIAVIAEDASGNIDSCSWTATWAGSLNPPEVICPTSPPNIIYYDSSCVSIIEDYRPQLQIDTTTGNLPFVVNQLPLPNTPLNGPGGFVTISLSVTDAIGLVGACNFQLAVGDTIAPSIDACAMITDTVLLTLPGGCVAEMPDYTLSVDPATQVYDNCYNPFLPGGDLFITQSIASGTMMDVSQSPVVLDIIVTDENGLSGNCQLNITIQDNEDPIISSCAPDTILYTDSASCVLSMPNFASLVMASDLCDSMPTVLQSLNGGFGPGAYSNVIIVVDNDNNNSVCAQSVTIIDTVSPVMACPSDLVIPQDPGEDGAVYTYGLPASTDACGTPIVTQTQGLVSGTLFPIGTSMLSFHALDGNANSSDCEYSVTVERTCAQAYNLVVQMVDETTAMVSWDDTVGVEFQVAFSPIGMSFATVNVDTPYVLLTGLMPNTEYIWKVRDRCGISGGTTYGFSEVDTFMTLPCLPMVSCPSDIVIGNDSGICGAVYSYVAPVGTDNCDSSSTVLLSGIGSGGTFALGANEEVFLVTSVSGETSSCSFVVTVEDMEAPVINCPLNDTLYTDVGVCETDLTYATPGFTDNCSATISHIQGNGPIVTLGTYTEMWEAMDSAGNSSTCSFDITVMDGSAPLLACPADIIVFEDPGRDSIDLSWPLIFGLDNCNDVVQGSLVSGLPNGSVFAVGFYTIVYEATDSVGNTSSCSFTVSVSDISDCEEITAVNSTIISDTTALLSWNGNSLTYQIAWKKIGDPLFSTDYSSTNNFLITGLEPDETYIWKVRDQCRDSFPFSIFGFTDLDTFSTGAPCALSITCPGDIMISTDEGICGAVVSYADPVVSSTCGVASISFTNGMGSGGTFDEGSTIESYSVSDSSGNSASCSFTVDVIDSVGPQLICPNDIVMVEDSPGAGAVVTFISPGAIDACVGFITPFQMFGLSSGSLFPTGTTQNAYAANDGQGNSSNCNFNINVIPDVGCPQPFNLVASAMTENTVVLSWNAPGVSDVQVAWRPLGGSFMTENISGGVDTFLVINLDPGTVYEWKVRDRCGVNGSNENPWTGLETFETLPSACPQIVDQFVTNIQAGGAVLNWTAPGLTVAQVAFKKVGDPQYSTRLIFGSSFFNLTGLEPGSTYIWKVRDQCHYPDFPASEFGFTGLDTFTTPMGIVCEAPFNLDAINITENHATLTWESSASDFQVAFRPITNPMSFWTTTNTSGVNSLDLTGLIAGQLYEWKIKDLCGGGNSSDFGWQGPVTFTTGINSACSKPDDLSATEITSSSARLGWTTTASNPSFQVAVKRIDVPSLFSTQDVISNSYEPTNLVAGATYIWKVKDLCGGPSTSVFGWSYIDTFSTLSGVNPPTFFGAGGNDRVVMDVYPNPARDVLNIDIDSRTEGTFSLIIYDIRGKQISEDSFTKSIGLNSNQLQISDISTGIYFLRYADDNQVKNFKFEKR